MGMDDGKVRRIWRGHVILEYALLFFILWSTVAQIVLVNGYRGSGVCHNSCSGHGQCAASGECSCSSGYRGGDCSERVCPSGASWSNVDGTGQDTAHAIEECSGAGICDRKRGTCQCRAGFGGHACERLLCGKTAYGICSGRGRCMTMSEYARFQDDQNAIYSTTYTSIWDADKISGCVCDPSSFGPHCEYFKCPSGDDPLTTGQLNEIQEIYCSCGGTCSGSFRLKFRGKTTKVSITHDAGEADVKTALENLLTIGNVDVTFTGASTICSAAGTSATVEFLSESGNLPPLRISRTTVSSSSNALIFEIGDGGVGGTGASADGTKENEPCSNRGFCDVRTGSCTCETGFASSDGEGNAGTRGDCGYVSDPGNVTECPYGRSLAGHELPYDMECSGHGHCSGSPSYACTCFEGWTGHDCQDRACPFGTAWFDEATSTDMAHAPAECSNRGTCDRFYGVCRCDPGFDGTACERMQCPNECSEHGECMTLAEIADYLGTTYGSDPNAMATWDAHKVRACVCDSYDFAFAGSTEGNVPDRSGFDCSLRSCPTGNPIANADAVNEEQKITCTYDGSGDASVEGFTFSFGGVTSSPILSTAVATTVDSGGDGTSVEEILEAMTTIGDVEVTFSTGDTAACSAAGTEITIKYFTNLGNLDLAGVSVAPGASVASASIAAHVDGTKIAVECAGAGLCDRTTGRCKCFRNMVSSDANNYKGLTGDCGAFEALYAG